MKATTMWNMMQPGYFYYCEHAGRGFSLVLKKEKRTDKNLNKYKALYFMYSGHAIISTNAIPPWYKNAETEIVEDDQFYILEDDPSKDKIRTQIFASIFSNEFKGVDELSNDEESLETLKRFI